MWMCSQPVADLTAHAIVTQQRRQVGRLEHCWCMTSRKRARGQQRVDRREAHARKQAVLHELRHQLRLQAAAFERVARLLGWRSTAGSWTHSTRPSRRVAAAAPQPRGSFILALIPGAQSTLLRLASLRCSANTPEALEQASFEAASTPA